MSHAAAVSDVDRLTREIHTLEAYAMEKATSAIAFKIEIGKRLLQARKLLKHGAFLPWAEKEFGWSPQHVRRHMLLARNGTRVLHLPPEASLRAALAAITEATRVAAGLEAAGEPEVRYLLALVWPDGTRTEVPLAAALLPGVQGRESCRVEVKRR